LTVVILAGTEITGLGWCGTRTGGSADDKRGPASAQKGDNRLRKLEKIVSDLIQMALSQEREIRRLREELALARLGASLDVMLSTMRVWPR
jgi:hypothetical protein